MKMKSCFGAMIGVLSFSAVVAAPVVDGVTVTQDASRLVTVTYDLTDEPAVITLDVLTNDVSIGAANITHVFGDANKLVSVGTGKKIYWKAQKSWPGYTFENGEVKAVVTAWPTNSPPMYMVVDLAAATTVRYYVSADALPDGGLTNDIYRTHRMVMRRIPAAGVEWRMGSPVGEAGREPKETAHYVTLSDDFYMAIYPMTCLQQKIASGQGMTHDTPYHPCELKYNELRGSSLGAKWPVDWQKHEVDDTSFLQSLRTLTGLTLDLPTSAQWEFACRAGTSTAYNNGSNVWSADIGWVWPGSDDKRQDVGLLEPNDWGLYDMHGNTADLCLDWALTADYYASEAARLDPVGPASGTERQLRGGHWGLGGLDSSSKTRSAFCGIVVAPDATLKVVGRTGFRLVAPCIAK